MLIFYSPVQLQGLHVNHWTAHNKTGFYGRSAAKLRHRGKMQNSAGGPQNGGDRLYAARSRDKTCGEQKSAPFVFRCFTHKFYEGGTPNAERKNMLNFSTRQKKLSFGWCANIFPSLWRSHIKGWKIWARRLRLDSSPKVASLRFGCAAAQHPLMQTRGTRFQPFLSLSMRVQVAASKISGGGWKATAENESFMCMKGRRPLCNPYPSACCRVCFLPRVHIHLQERVNVCENRIRTCVVGAEKAAAERVQALFTLFARCHSGSARRRSLCAACVRALCLKY